MPGRSGQLEAEGLLKVARRMQKAGIPITEIQKRLRDQFGVELTYRQIQAPLKKLRDEERTKRRAQTDKDDGPAYRLAAEQLGITDEVLNKHYLQPSLEDRKDRRDLLPSGTDERLTPKEEIGRAWMEFRDGSLSEEEFLAVADRARFRASLPGSKPEEGDIAYR